MSTQLVAVVGGAGCAARAARCRRRPTPASRRRPCRSGTPKRITAGAPGSRRRRRRRRSASRAVSCCWPGIEAIGTGAAMPSRTKAGWMRSPGASEVSRASARSAAVRRRRRGRSDGKGHARLRVAGARRRGARSPRPRPCRPRCARPRPRPASQPASARGPRGDRPDARRRRSRAAARRSAAAAWRTVLPLVKVMASTGGRSTARRAAAPPRPSGMTRAVGLEHLDTAPRRRRAAGATTSRPPAAAITSTRRPATPARRQLPWRGTPPPGRGRQGRTRQPSCAQRGGGGGADHGHGDAAPGRRGRPRREHQSRRRSRW